MATDEGETTAGETARTVQGLMALPGRVEGRREVFAGCVAEVVRVLGLDVVHKDAAVAIARSHPDEYIRHRVEHQVGD
ncbi:hypothetical protein [Streptomyces sp. SM10]|uniref:hypothetical protein n=1 Tax=Streptomyces sp. SM10 TaxID=565556 RepID=UPI000CDB7D67|nr:hypothetical protein [Streptomyces sp. SM10]